MESRPPRETQPRRLAAPREQEQSIKARKQLLFEEDEKLAPGASAPRMPFVAYLRTTPAAPLPAMWKAILGVAGAIVMLLLLAALWRLR